MSAFDMSKEAIDLQARKADHFKQSMDYLKKEIEAQKDVVLLLTNEHKPINPADRMEYMTMMFVSMERIENYVEMLRTFGDDTSYTTAPPMLTLVKK